MKKKSTVELKRYERRGDIFDMVARKASPRREHLKGEPNKVRKQATGNLLGESEAREGERLA